MRARQKRVFDRLGTLWNTVFRRRRCGTVRGKADDGTFVMPARVGSHENTLQFIANCAEKRLRLRFPNARNSVIRIVGLEPCGEEDVYNLEVEGTECFSIAGGLIVHNCADAVRYGLMEFAGMIASLTEVRSLNDVFDRTPKEPTTYGKPVDRDDAEENGNILRTSF